MKIFKRILIALAIIYILICCVLYFGQERLVFFPEKLPADFHFHFDGKFEEINIKAKDGTNINSVLFKADSAKGVIFYLHGNGGSLRSWGDVASTYTERRYDVLITDYRGYGKSDGIITSQAQLYGDLQTIYNELKNRYTENKIIVMGYSIGTGPATWISSVNNPKLLILHAPYYSLTDMMRHRYPAIPTFLLKYKFHTDEYIRQCKMPVVIFHGTDDKVIYYNSSVKLKEKMKSTDTLITLPGQGHANITYNPEYLNFMDVLLSK